MLKKRKTFWKAGVAEKNRILPLFIVTCMVTLVMAGCNSELSELSENRETVVDYEVYPSSEDGFDNAENIAAVYRDIYDEAVETNTLGSLETLQRIVARLGENGYVAVDSENQVDMAGAEQVIEFCKAVDEMKRATLTIIVIKDFGFRKFDLETEDGNVMIVRGYYQYDKNGCPQNRNMVSYPADIWQYTEEGYLLFEGSYFSNENYVLTLSAAPEHTALRVLPLDEKCRELNRQYILPVSYERNNMFLVDWNEADFGDLDFYDLYDIFYPKINNQHIPYGMDDNLGVGAVYRIPKEEFESVIKTYFNIESDALKSKTVFYSEDETYEYKPRGFFEAEYPEYPFPEVVRYTENEDGTITLTVQAVFPYKSLSKVYAHEVVIRPLDNGGVQYVSNRIIPSEDNYEATWHKPRLTEEQWEEMYGEPE